MFWRKWASMFNGRVEIYFIAGFPGWFCNQTKQKLWKEDMVYMNRLQLLSSGQ
jgi:hypothetical protein